MTENQSVAVTEADIEATERYFTYAGLQLSGDHFDMAFEALKEEFARHRLAAQPATPPTEPTQQDSGGGGGLDVRVDWIRSQGCDAVPSDAAKPSP